MLHSATSLSGPSFNFDCGGSFCSGSFSTSSVQYTVVGSYEYYCEIHGTQMNGFVNVGPASANHLVVNTSASSVTAGNSVTVTVHAFDQFGNADTNDNDSLQFSSTDAQASFGGGSLSGGSGTF